MKFSEIKPGMTISNDRNMNYYWFVWDVDDEFIHTVFWVPTDKSISTVSLKKEFWSDPDFDWKDCINVGSTYKKRYGKKIIKGLFI